MIAVVRCAYPFANLLQPGGRIEIAQQVVGILNYRVQFVAQSKIQRERLSDAPVVLQEAGITPIMDLPCGIADQLAPLIRYPGEEVFQRGGAGKDVIDSEAEFDSAAHAAIRPTRESVMMELGAELEGVLAMYVRNVIHQLVPGIGALYLGPVKTA